MCVHVSVCVSVCVCICVYVCLHVYNCVCMYASMCMSVYVYLYTRGRGQLVGVGSFFPQAMGMEHRSFSLVSAFNDKYLYLLSHHLAGPTFLSSVYSMSIFLGCEPLSHSVDLFLSFLCLFHTYVSEAPVGTAPPTLARTGLAPVLVWAPT